MSFFKVTKHYALQTSINKLNKSTLKTSMNNF